MADFPTNSKFPPCFYEADPMGIMNQIPEINPNLIESPSFNFNNYNPMSWFNENFFCNNQVSEFPGNLAETFPGLFHASQQNSTTSQVVLHGLDVVNDESVECKKRKILDGQEGSSITSSPVVSESGSSRKNGVGRTKRRKNGDKEGEKLKEVVHVRARRGQATDSHSLAERVRRGKINERLKCLQDIVPGCYKTMGMAVMLDEIINYVQSLQNQVEFLSMKLAAASTFYDFNSSEADAVDAMQRAKANEAKELERLMRIGNEGQAQFQPTWRP